MALAARFIPLRGTGKAAFLQCLDVARAAARELGATLAAAGDLADPDDVFMLTLDELTAARPPSGCAALAAERRAEHSSYLELEVPDLFYGVPDATPVTEQPAVPSDGGVVRGAPVSPGIVEGIARLVVDPSGDEPLEPGEILVCRTTDPSWASTMMLASALVIDIGGPISHGAIFARELGIPCVIGTRDATTQFSSGDRLRVDGQRGEVVRLHET